MTSTTANRNGPKVSVIIPAYKAEQTIRRAIDSVCAQTLRPAEIIVVDDGSPDNQNAVIREYGDRVTLVEQPNSKTAIARNAGLDRAHGDFIAFLDADDYWEPKKLEYQLAAFAKHPEVGVVGGPHFVEEPGCDRAPIGCNDPAWHDRVLWVQGERAFRLATMMWTGTLLVRREVLGEQRFVTGLEPAEDRDMWIRLALRGPVYLLSEPLSTAVLEPGSISRSNVDRDCSKMLELVGRHRATLGLWGTLVWRSHTLYRWAANDPNPRSALARLALSFWLWPLAYLNVPGMRRLGRFKSLLVLLARSAGIRSHSKPNSSS